MGRCGLMVDKPSGFDIQEYVWSILGNLLSIIAHLLGTFCRVVVECTNRAINHFLATPKQLPLPKSCPKRSVVVIKCSNLTRSPADGVDDCLPACLPAGRWVMACHFWLFSFQSGGMECSSCTCLTTYVSIFPLISAYTISRRSQKKKQK